MKERPILFSGPMVRAILAGTKTQTRRIVKDTSQLHGLIHPAVKAITHRGEGWYGFDASERVKTQYITTFPLHTIRCPYGVPGDRLWIKETWKVASNLDEFTPTQLGEGLAGRADIRYLADPDTDLNGKTRVSIHMPRWASRLNLDITGIRIERLQEISEADAKAEGIEGVKAVDDRRITVWRDYQTKCGFLNQTDPATKGPIASYRTLWDSINEERGFGWEKNPWVWVVEFKRL